jgi:hypothetical protein
MVSECKKLERKGRLIARCQGLGVLHQIDETQEQLVPLSSVVQRLQLGDLPLRVVPLNRQ